MIKSENCLIVCLWWYCLVWYEKFQRNTNLRIHFTSTIAWLSEHTRSWKHSFKDDTPKQKNIQLKLQTWTKTKNQAFQSWKVSDYSFILGFLIYLNSWKLGDHQKVPYSPTKDIVECERLNIEKKIKKSEIEYRLKVYGKTMARRRGLYKFLWLFLVEWSDYLNHIFSGDLKNDPCVKNVHIRRFEDYQMAEVSKRCDEIKIIDKEMTKIKKHISENVDIWKQCLSKLKFQITLSLIAY